MCKLSCSYEPGYLIGVEAASSTQLQVSVSPEHSHLAVLLNVKSEMIIVLIGFPRLIMR